MRKLSAILICLMMAAMLTACGGKGDSGSASSQEHSEGLQSMDSPTDDALGWGDFEIVE